jgi:IclR family transcriptional regulator, acetate operon repressor
MSNTQANGSTGVQSVGRAVTILEMLADSGGDLGVTELGRRLGVHKATASRLVATLADHGLVERNPATDKYRLGFGLIHLAGSAVAGMDLIREARPILEDLAERTLETVNLAVLDGDTVLNVDQITSPRAVASQSWVGRRTPYHCTSSGKVLLAFVDDGERDRLLGLPLAGMTAHTISDPEVLRSELADVRARGYARTIEELEEGLNAVAAPVRRADGEVVAAISVAGPAFRMRPVELPRIARLAVDAAGAISRRLGFVERRHSVGR